MSPLKSGSKERSGASRKRFVRWDGSCLLVDFCNRRIYEAPPGTRLKLIGDVDRVAARAGSSAGDRLLTFDESARQAGLARKTLYEWKRTGRLRADNGLVMVGRSPRIDWPVFKSYCLTGGNF